MDWFRRLLPGYSEHAQPAQQASAAGQQTLTPESLAGPATPMPPPAGPVQKTPSPTTKFWWWRTKANTDNGGDQSGTKGNKRMRTPPTSDRAGKRRRVESGAAAGQDDNDNIRVLAGPDEPLPSIERDENMFPNSTFERVRVGKQNFIAVYPTTLQGQQSGRLSKATTASSDANPAAAAGAAGQRFVAALGPGQQAGLVTPETEVDDDEDDEDKWKRAQYRDGRDSDLYQNELDDAEVKAESSEAGAKSRGRRTTTATPKSTRSTRSTRSNAGRIENDPALTPRRKGRSNAPLTPGELAALRDIKEAEVVKQTEEGWSTPDVDLFRRLNMRSLEPLLPSHLFADLGRFPEAMPAALFTDNDQEAFLRPSGHPRADKSTEFRHVRALQNLVRTGRRVRSCQQAAVKGDTWLGGEHWAKFTADAYHRWALADIGLSPLNFRDRQQPQLRTLTIVELPRHEKLTGADMTMRVEEALLTLEATWLNSGFAEVPPLYALVMHGTSTVVAALADPASVEDEANKDKGKGKEKQQQKEGEKEEEEEEEELGRRIRPMETIDWADPTMDVWNALGVAIVVVHCRNALQAALDDAVEELVVEEEEAAAGGGQQEQVEAGNDGEDDPDA